MMARLPFFVVNNGDTPMGIDLKTYSIGLVLADRNLWFAAHQQVLLGNELSAVGELPAPQFQ